MTKQQLVTLILDAIGGILTIWIYTLVDEATAKMILATYAVIQPVLIGVLALISYDGKARMEATSRDMAILSQADPEVRQTLMTRFYGGQARKK